MRYGRVWRVTAIGAAGAAAVVLTTGTPGEAGSAVASASLVDINGERVGDALFTSHGDGSVTGRVTVAVDRAVTDPAGAGSEFHGLHVHANNDDDTGDGNADDGCITFAPGSTPAPAQWFTQVDSHWDVGGHSHGNHTGDLPSLVRQADGEATIEFAVDKLTAGQLPGRALVVHFAADDFGKHPTVGTSATTGNAGPRYACGVIVASARAN
jgi:Cu-Zn family superoxide dismutase